MDNTEPTNQQSNLAELAHRLEQAKRAIPVSQERLQHRNKPQEKYLILRDGTVAETDHSREKGKTIIKETIG